MPSETFPRSTPRKKTMNKAQSFAFKRPQTFCRQKKFPERTRTSSLNTWNSDYLPPKRTHWRKFKRMFLQIVGFLWKFLFLLIEKTEFTVTESKFEDPNYLKSKNIANLKRKIISTYSDKIRAKNGGFSSFQSETFPVKHWKQQIRGETLDCSNSEKVCKFLFFLPSAEFFLFSKDFHSK